MKGLFIPEITAEMFRNGCLESIETLMAEGEIYDIEYSRWIPVSERLPEESGEYLVTYNGIATTLNYSDKYGWYYDDGEHFTQFGDDVLAWMPLPAPYVEKSEGKE